MRYPRFAPFSALCIIVACNVPVSKAQLADDLAQGIRTYGSNSSGAQTALTQYNYDENVRTSSGVSSSQQFDLAPPAGNFRGNNTSKLRWLNTGTLTCPNGQSGGSGANLIGTMAYFDDGMLYTSVEPRKNTTSFTYCLTYWGAYPTTVTNALNQGTNSTHNFNTGLLTSTTDANNKTTNYSYDSMWRLASVNYPDGRQETITSQPTIPHFLRGTTVRLMVNSFCSTTIRRNLQDSSYWGASDYETQIMSGCRISDGSECHSHHRSGGPSNHENQVR
jgi:YD repeat-containing protein